MTDPQPGATDEFADYDGPLLPDAPRFDLARLLDPSSVRALAVVVGTTVLIVADRTPRLYALVIGAALVVVGLSRLAKAWRRTDDRPTAYELIFSVAFAITGAVLVLWPGQTTATVARIVGVMIVVAGLLRLLGPVLRFRPPAEDRQVEVVTGTFLIAMGVAVLVVPIVIGRIAFGVIAMIWLIDGVTTLVMNLRIDADTSTPVSGRQRFIAWIEGRPDTAGDRERLYDTLFYEGAEAQRQLSRFFILMALATAIAGYGVVSNSTATVIGAMLVAPLMTPLMGTTVSLVMGWPRRATMSLMVAAGGIAVAVALGFIIGSTIPFDLTPDTNGQISSRISPTLSDLAVAIAAGSAGAFGLSRHDVSDALPGVAVAIALVPPLAVSGLMLNAGEFEAAWGSFLLFSTNMLAILLAGAVTFVLTGIAPIGQLLRNRRRIQSSLTLVGALGVLVVAVLSISSQRINSEAFDRQAVEDATDAWLEGTELMYFESTITHSSAEIVVTGPEQPPSIDDLGRQIESDVGRSLDVTVVWVPNQEFTYDGLSDS